jgi:hypothetical protein
MLKMNQFTLLMTGNKLLCIYLLDRSHAILSTSVSLWFLLQGRMDVLLTAFRESATQHTKQSWYTPASFPVLCFCFELTIATLTCTVSLDEIYFDLVHRRHPPHYKR